VSLKDRVDRSSVSLLDSFVAPPGEPADCRGECREYCLRLFDRAVDIYAATKNLTMLDKLRTMLEKRFSPSARVVSCRVRDWLKNVLLSSGTMRR
jgi:hypothetical protein